MSLHHYARATAALLTSSLATGTGIELSYQDATAAGRGNAAVASADSPAAVYHNPAGLGFLTGTEVQAGLLLATGKTTYSGGGRQVSSTSDPSYAGSAFVSHALSDTPFVLGFGLTTPHGLSIEYANDAPFRNRGFEGELRHAAFTGAIGYRYSETLSFGAGITVVDSDLTFTQGLAFSPDRARYDGSGSGVGFSIGAIWRPCDAHSLGLTYRSATKVDYDGSVDTLLFDPLGAFTFSFDGDTSLEFPQQIVLGYQYRPNDTWSIEANVKWTDWTSFDRLVVETPAGTEVTNQDYSSGLIWSLGASYAVSDATTLNFGYLYGESTSPDAGFSPLVPDADLHVFSVGVDQEVGQWTLSAAYLYGIKEDRDVVGSQNAGLVPGNADGSYETSGHTVLLTVARKF